MKIRATVIAVLWLLSLLYVGLRAKTDPPLLSDDFMVVMEEPYGGNGQSGIQFFAIQRIESKSVDQAVLSIDGDLPLAVALRAVNGKRVKITLESKAAMGLQELKR